MGLKIETKDDLKDLILAIKECGIKGKIDVTIPDIHIVIDESGYTEKPTLKETEKEALIIHASYEKVSSFKCFRRYPWCTHFIICLCDHLCSCFRDGKDILRGTEWRTDGQSGYDFCFGRHR